MEAQYDKGAAFPADGRRRVVIEKVAPEVDGGRFPVKRISGDRVTVTADIFGDGHDKLAAVLLYRRQEETSWMTVPMSFAGNDRWKASFIVEEPGVYCYTVRGRIDHFETWRQDLSKKRDAGQDISVDLRVGAEMIQAAAERAQGGDRDELLAMGTSLNQGADAAFAAAGNPALARLMDTYDDPELSSCYERVLTLVVERREGMCGAWYELFPRSCTSSGSHGSFADCRNLLPKVAAMGFDIVYLPPIHPIGRINRKGKNNSTTAGEGDPGSPWAVGAAEGGHKALHRELGTIEDFRKFVADAKRLGMQVAIDVAFQCAPDHPYVKEHPEWFRWRPDGSVQYAENPPKKYEDIIPFDFECNDWRALWEELKSVFLYWVGEGITIFRVDNPHTKPFPFWEWVIREVKNVHPETVFLSEAFTRPKVMYRLAKLGFSQSYTYFSWRNTKWELEQYVNELAGPELREFFRPNFWPNTPDILPEFLQIGGNAAFAIRFLLAATLSASYGIYGPPFELFVNAAVPGKEEYLDSEKYEVRRWDWEDPQNLRELITRVNRVRRENPALQSTWNTRFCDCDNDNVIAYVKISEDRSNIILVAVNLDPFGSQGGEIRIPLDDVGILPGHPYLVHDLLGGGMNLWHGERNRVEFHRQELPGRIWRLYPRLRRENDFDYYM
ncbi:alpha-1,4-glucan--maltose-1-phosphate maltosyltransferase [Geobacter sp. DSM 9736]|uniref:alpha-1,4-glucan--maltose-1-phosphate maltosyltransferase n=1 Tax=Geobacter sp. DSM 9736 TaxID=1277350 RepID=UPI000B51041B|nr:alpha-1,4-glucan--maltose-1-phosphate maltosyltransferase [Geobacter sp. DSM 9736]SNB47351.1 alpha-1,4-glucan:maltose-1-phosphate maltosyltransferase [Geobacter sp. DSM 9736]